MFRLVVIIAMLCLGATAKGQEPGKGKYSDYFAAPHDIRAFFDLDEAFAYASKAGKPVLVYFTGIGCINSRQMEENVLTHPDIRTILDVWYVTAILYADSRKAAHEEDRVTDPSGKVYNKIGEIYCFEVRKLFGTERSPSLIISDACGNMIAPVQGYTKDVEKFKLFLKSGVEKYANLPDR